MDTNATALDRLRHLRDEAAMKVRRLGDQLEEINGDIRVERARQDAIEEAIGLLEQPTVEEPTKASEPRQPPGAVEKAIHSALAEFPDGANIEVIEGATNHKRASLLAALRRMVAAGIVDREGELYRPHRAEREEAAE